MQGCVSSAKLMIMQIIIIAMQKRVLQRVTDYVAIGGCAKDLM